MIGAKYHKKLKQIKTSNKNEEHYQQTFFWEQVQQTFFWEQVQQTFFWEQVPQTFFWEQVPQTFMGFWWDSCYSIFRFILHVL
jgi:hypothetical protein